MQVQFDNLPTELNAQPIVIWTYSADGKKPPLNPLTKRYAERPGDVSMSLDDAKEWHLKGVGDGIGIMPRDDLIFIDVDGCIKNGRYSKTALKIMKAYRDAYWEVSPSGEGLRGMMRGQLPDGFGYQTQRVKGGGSRSIEVYGSHSHDTAYVTLTGNKIPNTGNADNTLVEHDLSPFAAAFLPKRKRQQTTAATNPLPLPLSDSELLDKAYKSAKGADIKALLEGQQRYKSASDDHYRLAAHLAFWFAKDFDRIKGVMTAHDVLNKNPTQRKKGKNYLDRTIRKAIANTHNTYTPRQTHHRFFVSNKETAIELLCNVSPDNEIFVLKAIGAWLGTVNIEPRWRDKFADIFKKVSPSTPFDDAWGTVEQSAKAAKNEQQAHFLGLFDLNRIGGAVQALERDDLVDNKYLPDIDVKDGETLLIQSPLGTGKTEALARVVKRLKADKKLAKIAYLVPRRSLASGAIERIELMHYEVIKAGDKETAQDNAFQLVAVINSLPALVQDLDDFDLVVLDESELLFNHAIGGTIRNKKLMVDTLYQLIGNAKCVVCLDAYLSHFTVKCLRNAGRDNLRSIVCNVSPWDHVVADWYESKDDLQDTFISDLTSGGSPFIVCSTKAQAEVLAEICADKCPDKRVLLLTSDTSGNPDAVEFMSNPTEAAQQWDCVITSPSVEAGLSVTVDKFSNVYAFFEPQADGTGNLQGAIQQLGRCRKAQSWRIYAPDKTFHLPTEPLEHICANKAEFAYACKRVLNHDGSLQEVTHYDTKSPLAKLYGDSNAFDAIQRNHFSRHLWALLEQLNMPINFIPNTNSSNAKAERDAAKDTILTRKAQELKDAEQLFNDNDYEALANSKDKDHDSKRQLERYRLEQKCCMSFDDYDLDESKAFLSWYDDGRGYAPIKYLDLVQCSPEQVHAYGRLRLLGGAHKIDTIEIKGKDILDHSHAVQRQYDLLRIILNIAGVLEERSDGTAAILPLTETTFSNADFQKNAVFSSLMQNFLQENPKKCHLAGIKVPTDWQKNPCRFVIKLLKKLGFSLQSSLIRSARGGASGSLVSVSLYRTDHKCDNEPSKPTATRINQVIGWGDNYLQHIVTRREQASKNWVTDILSKYEPRNIDDMLQYMAEQPTQDSAAMSNFAQLSPQSKVLSVLSELHYQHNIEGISKAYLCGLAQRGLSNLKVKGDNQLLEPWWLATTGFVTESLSNVQQLLHEAQYKICKQYQLEPMF